MIEKQFLLILAGLPSAGKSSFADFMKKALKSTAPDLKVKIIDPDYIRKEIAPQSFNHEVEHLVRANNLKNIREALKKKFIVISDDLNYYTSMRHDIKEIAEEFLMPFFIIHISTPIEICLKWNDQRGNPIPNEVIHRINEKFDSFDKYYWEKPLLSCDCSKDNIHEITFSIINLIEEKLENLVEKRVTIQKLDSKKGSKEKLESVSRKIVGNLLNNQDLRDLKFIILNLRKKYVRGKKRDITSEDEIERDFLDFLNKNLNLDTT